MREYQDPGETIRIEMVRCGYTLETLAEKTAISPAVLRGILSGRAKTVSTRNVAAMASAFGYDMAAFLDKLSRVP